MGIIQCLLCLQMQYAKYMESHSIEGVRHVYSRACTIHLSKKPMVHLLWAAFEEQQGEQGGVPWVAKAWPSGGCSLACGSP